MSRLAEAAAPAAGTRARPPAAGGAPALLLLACALPHALRAAWPLVEFGGGETLLAARRLASGGFEATSQDGPLLLERLLGGVLALTGGAPRALELATIALVLVTAFRLRALGRRLAGPWAGAVAALAWSAHPWVLQRHLFDRGLWAAPFVALALERLLAGSGDRRGGWGLTLALAAAVVVDTPFAWPPLLLAALVLAGRRRWLPAAAAAGALLALPLVSSAVAAAVLAAGPDAAGSEAASLWRPASLFGGPAAPATAAQRLGALAAHADPLLVLAALAALVLGVRRRRGPAGLPALLLLFELVRAALRLPHDGAAALIGPALPAALLVGLALEAALGGGGAPLRNAAVAVTALLMALVIFDVFGGAPAPDGTPRRSVLREWLTDRWRPPQEGYGLFGGRPRSQLAARVALLEAHSLHGDRVGGAWAWEAAAADRPHWTPRAGDDAMLLLEPLPAGVDAGALAAAGWRRLAAEDAPDVGAWLAPARAAR